MNYKEIFENKTVLITGGTGFLGRALTKEILKFNPHSIRIFSRDEVKHHQMQELFNYDDTLRHFIGDVRDYERINRAIKGADIVIHAAALKRLDMIEYNVDESVKTNIIGTLNVARACTENNVEKAIFTSTDKACSPINSYGACKFLAERIFADSNRSKGATKTTFSIVRYGNVLESTGSIIPFFKSKIKKGKDIPLTDKRMTRFIINQKQAVELIFNALKYSKGAETFVPKLPSFKIIDLINVMKKEYKVKNKIKIIGIRPGEKIDECMINRAEIRRTYEFQDMYIILSEINSIKDAEYIKSGKKLSKNDFSYYGSDQKIMNEKDITKLLKKFGAI